ncbi:MAG: DUF1289 domain-containing protein [Burkholderiaceae bacterium]|nr:DUF1289 domain-containing protein [Burkholderiaceae bacterium]
MPSASRPPPRTVRSPCVSICRIVAQTGYCEGCLRTIDEIANWGTMSDAQRHEIWSALRVRRAEAARALAQR